MLPNFELNDNSESAHQKLIMFLGKYSDLPIETLQKFHDYFISLIQLELDNEGIELTMAAISAFVDHNLQSNSPHLINELFAPQIDPDIVHIPADQVGPPLDEFSISVGVDFLSKTPRIKMWTEEIINRIESTSLSQPGTFTVISGPMYSGKTSQLITAFSNFEGERPTRAYVSQVVGEPYLIARNPKLKIPAKSVTLQSFLADIQEVPVNPGEVIAIDEVPFIPMPDPNYPGDILPGETYIDAHHRRCQEFIDALRFLQSQGAHVLVCGLPANVISEDFLLTEYLNKQIFEEVHDRYACLNRHPAIQGLSLEGVYTIPLKQQLKFVQDIGTYGFDRTYSPNFGSDSLSGVRYNCAAFYAYRYGDDPGDIVISSATETVRTALHLLPDEEEFIDLLWPVVLPRREGDITEVQAEKAHMVKYYSRAPYCHIWAFLKEYRPELYFKLKERIYSGANNQAFLNLLGRYA